MDLLLNLIAPQDHIPLGITWVASGLLELEAALLNPVPLDIVMIPTGRGLQPLASLAPHWAEAPPPLESRH